VVVGRFQLTTKRSGVGGAMTKAARKSPSTTTSSASIRAYRLSVVDSGGNKLGESLAQLRVK
jgi:hypothetical protein